MGGLRNANGDPVGQEARWGVCWRWWQADDRSDQSDLSSRRGFALR